MIKIKNIVLIYFATFVIYGILLMPTYSMNCRQDFQKYKACVVANGEECAKIGSAMFLAGGSAADAAIATLLCDGVSLPHAMGLGGGFLMTMYNKQTGEAISLNARETAPAASTPNMYHGNRKLAEIGALSVAVPGELKGLWELHQRYGILKWKKLFRPTIQLCREGIKVTKFFNGVLQDFKQEIINSPSLRAVFINPVTKNTWQVGDHIKMIQLARTLDIIASEGAKALYTGSLTKMLVREIQDLGGIITDADMKNYTPVWCQPIKITLQDKYTLYSIPLPGAGPILSFILNLIDGFVDFDKLHYITNWQRIVESFKFGYGRRTELGDTAGLEELIANLSSKAHALDVRKFIYDDRTYKDAHHYGANFSQISDDHGTGHIAVLAPNGDAISVTSTINLSFGSQLLSRTTGLLLNDEMDDFSDPRMVNAYNIPPSPANHIGAGKRPMSSISSTIIIDEKGDVRLVVGGSGGPKITTATALVIMWNVLLDEPIDVAIDKKRLHHQLSPMEILYEVGYNMSIIKGLSKIGHKRKFINLGDGFASVTGIARQCDTLHGSFDKRRQGSVELL